LICFFFGGVKRAGKKDKKKEKGKSLFKIINQIKYPKLRL
jgi:hypothetical protein